MDFAGLLGFIVETLIRPLTVTILALAIVYFLWHTAQGILKGNSPEDRAQFRTRIVWSIVAIAVMVSLWGIVGLLLNTFDLGFNAPTYPEGGGPGSDSVISSPGDTSPWACDFGGPCGY